MRNIIKNKKGEEKENNIGLIVAIALIFIGFAIVWYFFGAQIKAAFFAIAPTKVNVDTVKSQCLQAYQANKMTDYCCVTRSTVFKDGSPAVDVTCQDSRLKGEGSLDCTNYVCVTQKCSEKNGHICANTNCTGENWGVAFTDLATGQVCCKTACTA